MCLYWGNCFYFFFFFNDTATTEIYTLSLHDAHPISGVSLGCAAMSLSGRPVSLWSDMTRKLPSLAVAAVLAVLGAVAVQVSRAAPAAALDNGLALTPPMGFNDWNAFGCNVDQHLIEQTADAMAAN